MTGSSLRRAFMLCIGTLFAALAAQAAPPPAEQFARQPAIEQVQMSPSGKRLAMIVTGANGWQGAVVLDLPVKGPAHTVLEFGDADIRTLHWVNDDRLVLNAFEPGFEVRQGGGGVFAVNHDGSELVQLVSWRDNTATSINTRISSRLLPYGWFFHSTLDDGSADVVMVERITNALREVTSSKLARVNTLTRLLTPIGRGIPSGVHNWVLDASGEPRVLRDTQNGRDRLLVRDASGDGWVPAEDVAWTSQSGMQPEYLEADGQLVVSAYAGGDTAGYYSYDLKKRKLDPEPLVRLSRYDVEDWQAGGKQQLVGAHVVTDRPQSVWFDQRMANIQKAVDAALPPGRFNTLNCGRCETSPYYVVHSQSDRQPGAYFVYDHAKSALTPLGESRPWIDEAAQGQRTAHWVTARDGLSFPVVVTHPPGASAQEPLPAVVLVHGGPWVRGADRRWEAEAQFLATRGYRVIEPNFRGSLGLGWKLFRAGWKEWGLSMQDDLADAVQWAVAQKLVDASRVCIYGGSYGGYAALMGPIRNPGTYRCAASFAGVTDIDLMFTSNRSDMTSQSRRYTMPQLVGDPNTDAAKLRQSSPLARVSEIKVPVLLVQGTRDRRVPREHANAFESAARGAGVDLQRVDYGDEGHGWYLARNHADFLNRLDRFLATSLKPK